MRVTHEVLATSPDPANKRGLATTGASASALGCSAHRNVERHRSHAFSVRGFAGAGQVRSYQGLAADNEQIAPIEPW